MVPYPRRLLGKIRVWLTVCSNYWLEKKCASFASFPAALENHSGEIKGNRNSDVGGGVGCVNQPALELRVHQPTREAEGSLCWTIFSFEFTERKKLTLHAHVHLSREQVP